jgi:hypothetical protein
LKASAGIEFSGQSRAEVYVWVEKMLVGRLLQAENKVPLGFVEGLNNKIRVLQRRAYGMRDEEYLRLKVLTCMLPEI